MTGPLGGMPGAGAALLAAAALSGAAPGADPARIVVDPDSYLGRTVMIAVRFARVEPGREAWEGQARLTPAAAVKFRVAPLGEIRCYADRTRRNEAALAGLSKGTRIVLTGAVKRYRTKVVTRCEVRGKGRRGTREVVRTVRGRVRYAFLVDSIRRAE